MEKLVSERGRSASSLPYGGVLDIAGTTASIGTVTGTADGSVNIGTGGKLTLNQGADGTYAGAFTGNGKLTKAGSGILTLTGDSSSFTGNLALTDGETVLDGNTMTAGVVFIGSVDEPTLSVQNGGALDAANVIVGNSTNNALPGIEDESGALAVTGNGSSVTADFLTVGYYGDGALAVTDGGQVVATTVLTVGSVEGSTGSVTVSGEGSRLEAGAVSFGGSGTGILNLADGATMETGSAGFGVNPGTVGTGTVSGEGTRWDIVQSNLVIGSSGQGALDVTNGAVVAVSSSGGDVALGSSETGSGTLTVSGTGTLVTAADLFTIGSGGAGVANVSEGGQVSGGRLIVGFDGGSDGMLDISGAGTLAQGSGYVMIGTYAGSTGTVTLTDGATLKSDGGRGITLGFEEGSAGTLNIGAAAGDEAGAAGLIDAVNGIQFGGGTGTLVLNHTDSAYELSAGLSGAGTVDVLAGTTVLGGDSSGFAGSFNVGGGRLVLANAANAVSTTIGTKGTLQIGNGGITGSLNGDVVNDGAMIFDRSDALHHNRVISGTGDLTIAGGAITLSGMNTFTGATTIDEGASLALSNQGRVNKSSLVTVNGTFDVTEGSAPRINDIAGSGTVVLGDSGLQIDNASHVFSGQMTGTGGLYVNAGTLTLTGENDFVSGLGIGDATVRIGDGGTTGSITASTLNYGTLIFDRSNEWTYGGAITGRGEIVHTGAGTTNLTGGLGGNHLIVENGTVNHTGGLVALFGEGAGIVVQGENSQLNVTNVGARATNTVYLVRDGGSLAISGGSIKVGSSAESAGVHLQSGNASVTGTTFTVGGANTYGVVVDAGNTLTVAGSTIATASEAAIGALARDGGALAISGTTIETEGTDAYAVHATNGGTITLTNSMIATSGLMADALVSDGESSLISTTDTAVETTGIQTAAVVARNNGAIDLTGGAVSASGQHANGVFAYNSGSVSAQGLTISTSGEQARGVYANADSHAAGSVTLTDVTIGASGTSAHGLFAKRDGGSTGSQIAAITGENVALTVEGNQANGVYAAVGGIITLNGGSVSTSGLEGHALHAQQFDGGMTGGGVITASGLTVTTSGIGAVGALAEAGGKLSLADSRVSTSGEGSYGLYAMGSGELAVTDTAIHSATTGAGISSSGTLEMTGGSIQSTGAALSATTSDDNLATFRFTGTDLTQNNGTLLAVEHQQNGNGSGAAKLSLLDGSTAKGTIVGIGEGDLDVIVSRSSLEGAISNVSKLTLDNALWTVTGLKGLGELEIASGSTTISTATTIAHDGALTGSGTLIKSGTGRFVLSGDGSDFAGTTRINAGALVLTGALDGTVTIDAQGTMIVGDGVTNGDLTASTVNDGSLIFNQIGDYDYTGALSGNGGLVKQGSGTLLLSGDYGYTGSTVVDAGKIRLLAELDSKTDLVVNDGEFDLSGTDQTVAGLSGTGGTVNIGTSMLTVNQATNTDFGGVFTGSGQIVLQSPSFVPGAPTIINLTGASTDFMGDIALRNITARINGSMGGAILVGDNAALGGSGQTNDIVIQNGGTLLPGNSIGTLTAAGNVVFEAGSTYEVEVNAEGESDKLLVGGTATINGGTVSVLAAAGNYRFTSDYVIISAEGGVTGTFDDTDVDLPFLTPFLRYDVNDVVLTLQRNDRSFESVAVTPNQIAVALALDASNQEASLPRAVAGQIEEAGAVRAFDALSGELWATTGTLMIDGTRRMGEMVTGRLEQADIVSRALANSGASARTLDDGSTALWGQGIGSWSTLQSNGNATRATQSTFGFITGIDTSLGDWRLGVAFSHGQDKIRVDGRSSEASVNSNSIAAYAGGGWGALRARIGASYSWLDVNGTRKVVFPGVDDALAGDYNAQSASAFGELSYALSLGAATMEPFAGMNHVRLKSDAFTETGSSLTALEVEDRTRNVTYTTLGLRVGGAIPISTTSVLTTRVSAAWLRSFGDVDANSRHILSTGEAFSIAGLPTTRDTLRLEGGLQANILPGGSIGATYVGNFGDQWKDHGVKLGFSYSF